MIIKMLTKKDCVILFSIFPWSLSMYFGILYLNPALLMLYTVMSGTFLLSAIISHCEQMYTENDRLTKVLESKHIPTSDISGFLEYRMLQLKLRDRLATSLADMRIIFAHVPGADVYFDNDAVMAYLEYLNGNYEVRTIIEEKTFRMFVEFLSLFCKDIMPRSLLELAENYVDYCRYQIHPTQNNAAFARYSSSIAKYWRSLSPEKTLIIRNVEKEVEKIKCSSNAAAETSKKEKDNDTDCYDLDSALESDNSLEDEQDNTNLKYNVSHQYCNDYFELVEVYHNIIRIVPKKGMLAKTSQLSCKPNDECKACTTLLINVECVDEQTNTTPNEQLEESALPE